MSWESELEKKEHYLKLKEKLLGPKKEVESNRKQYRKEYYAKNKEKLNLLNKINYQLNRESILAHKKRYVEENKEAVSLKNKIRYQRKKALIIKETEE